jgi:hypothetical protein
MNMLAKDFFDVFSSYGFTVIPLFVLMGQVAFNAGIARQLYQAAYRFIGHIPGGLAMATVVGAMVFKAICGSSTATAATFASVAVPEMDRYGYDKRLSTGVVASVGTLGILIPPSVTLIVFGMPLSMYAFVGIIMLVGLVKKNGIIMNDLALEAQRREGNAPAAAIYEACANIRPSARGEFEITDLNLEYLRRGQLRVYRLSRGFAWLDAGTSSSLQEASAYVQTIEKRQGIKIGCPEEAAFRRGFLSLAGLETLTTRMPKCEYREYLAEVIAEAKRLASDAP